MSAETSQSIREWAEAAFGPVADLRALVERARVELDELEAALDAGDAVEAGREAADVAILLHRLAALNGCDLSEQVDAKMRLNRARIWVRAGDGTGRHV
jgi:hypothetical protein